MYIRYSDIKSIQNSSLRRSFYLFIISLIFLIFYCIFVLTPITFRPDYRGKKWTCKKCNGVFKSKALLGTHRKLHHPNSDYYTFDECTGAYTCYSCDFIFLKKREMEDHVMVHREIHKCPTCYTVFIDSFKFAKHLAEHNDGELQCPNCPYTTKAAVYMQKHIRERHLPCKSLVVTTCVVCKMEFKHTANLRTHQVQFHRVNIEGVPLPGTCPHCSRCFAREETLLRHIQGHLEGRKRHRKTDNLCDVCGKNFSYRQKLELHYRIHTGYKPFECSYCGKCFSRKCYLQMHERVHSGERPYGCDICGKFFTQQSVLTIHMRTHTGEKPYECLICGSRFTSTGARTTHMKTCGNK